VRELLLLEVMKSRTRWLPYVLCVFLAIGVVAQIWLFGYVDYRQSRGELGDYNPGLFTLTFPYCIVALADAGQYWAPIFIAFFVASSVATEFAWGTARLAVARGVTRWQWFVAKLLGSALIAAAALLVLLGVGLLLSAWATAVADQPIPSYFPDGPSSAEVPVIIGRAALTIIPYGVLAFMLAMIGRSTAVGAAGMLIYKLVESAAVGIFTELGGRWEYFRIFFLEYYAQGVLSANRFGSIEYNSIALRELPSGADTPGPWVSAFMLAFYSVLFAGVAWWFFRSRDLNARTE
jgi:ABC-type transport system involved in multi-copper enzyme maturation permease subunit